jgi:hypothetical protein
MFGEFVGFRQTVFKAALRDSAIVGDLTGFVETAGRKNRAKTKCSFTLPGLRSVLNLAGDEWRFGREALEKATAALLEI